MNLFSITLHHTDRNKLVHYLVHCLLDTGSPERLMD